MIKIIGVSKKKSLEIQDKIEKYVKLLKIKSKIDNNDIIVKVVKKYSGLSFDDIAAYMFGITKRPNGQVYNYHEIIIKKKYLYSNKTLSMALMHELVHLKQALNNKLAFVQYREGTGVFAFWKKSKLGKVDDLEYWSRPWEVEAMAIEERMWKERRL